MKLYNTYIFWCGYLDRSELVLQLMMEGGSFESVLIKVPSEDVSVELSREFTDVVVVDN